MDDDPPPRMCGYVACIMLYMFSCIFVWFGYQNNSWLVVKNSNGYGEFQRGLNDDCVFNSSHSPEIQCATWGTSSAPFPSPFDKIVDPPKLLYVVMFMARFLLVWPLLWLIFGISCCFNAKCEKFAKRKNVFFIHLQVIGHWLFIFMFVFLLICVYTTSVMEEIPKGYTQSFGTGLYLFVCGGSVTYSIAGFYFFKDECVVLLRKRIAQVQGREYIPAPVNMNSLESNA